MARFGARPGIDQDERAALAVVHRDQFGGALQQRLDVSEYFHTKGTAFAVAISCLISSCSTPFEVAQNGNMFAA